MAQQPLWQKYCDIEPIRRLRNEGRELLGKTVMLTEKRDGENVSIWLDADHQPHISSHNQAEASSDIASRFKATPEYAKAVQLLKDELAYNNHFILYGELLKPISPTRIEPRRKHIHWILFDIWSVEEQRYLSYNAIYPKAYHYKIPVVKIFACYTPMNMDELWSEVKAWVKMCKRHRREGVVGKCYENQTFFKEKVDLPDLPKMPRKSNSVNLPLMPEEKVIRALQHAYDEVGAEHWKDVKTAMPIVAKHISNEAREHNYSPPRNLYNIYVNTPLQLLQPIVATSQP